MMLCSDFLSAQSAVRRPEPAFQMVLHLKGSLMAEPVAPVYYVARSILESIAVLPQILLDLLFGPSKKQLTLLQPNNHRKRRFCTPPAKRIQ